MLGTKELNKKLQEELNPSSDEKNEKKVGEVIFREGDRVMQVKNNYDIYWEKGNTLSLTYESGTGIFNGELGKIVKIDFLNKQIKILFDDEKRSMVCIFRYGSDRTCICDNCSQSTGE